MRGCRVVARFRPAVLFCLLAACWCPSAIAAEPGLRLVYDTTTTEVRPSGSDSPGEKTTQGTLTARLAPDRLAVREGDDERIYDFAARRVVMLDHGKQQSYDLSLYAIPGFRDQEFDNRRMMAQMMAAIGQKTDLADVETGLGMLKDAPAKLKMREERRGEERVFFLNEREATAFAPAATSLPPALAPVVAHLYLYEARLHPRVRQALTSEPVLPARLVFSWRLVDLQTTVTWQLREAVEEDLDLAAAATQYPFAPLVAEGVPAIAFRVRAGQAGSQPAAATYESRADRLIAAGRGFEAFLVLSELGFASGGMPEDSGRRAAQAAASDPRMQSLKRVMEIEAAREDAKAALKLLEPLDAEALEGGPAIHVQRANQFIRLGDGKKALQEFTQALATNPFMLGPWLDAGQIYFGGYQMNLAWACWDAARAIAPDSPLLKQVNELEASLRRKHPEFF